MQTLTKANAVKKADNIYSYHKQKVRDTIDSKLYTLSRSVSKMVSYGRKAGDEKTRVLTTLLDGIVDFEQQNTLRSSSWKDIKRKKKT